MFRGILSQLPPFFLPAQAQVGVDLRVTLFLGALTLLTGNRVRNLPGAAGLSAQSGRGAEGRRPGRGGKPPAGSFLRNALVISQVALAFVLLCGAGLLIRSFNRLTNVDAGFDATNVVTMSFQMVMGRDVDGARLTGYVDQAIETVRAVPGVQDAAMTSALPLQGLGIRDAVPDRRPSVRSVTPPAVLLQDRDAGVFRHAQHEASKGTRAHRARCEGRASRHGRQRDVRPAAVSRPGSDRPARA